MAVTCVQIADSVVQVEILIPYPPGVTTDQELLDWKAAMHEAHGWLVDWAQNRRSFNATKSYPASNREVDPNAILAKSRLFRRAGQ